MPQNSTPTDGLTNEEKRRKWNQLFQSNLNGFKDKWIVLYQEEHPESDEWEMKDEEYIKITFKCKDFKCSRTWTLGRDEGRVHFFVRRNQHNGLHKNQLKGEVLICLDYQQRPNPICPCATVPEMTIDNREMSAVLSYLKMKIGRFYYDIDYPNDAEKRIEKNRKKKGKVTRMKEIVHDNSHNSTLASPASGSLAAPAQSSAKSNTLIKPFRGENKENINHEIQVGNKPNSSATKSAVKHKKKKKEKLQNKTVVISGSPIVPAARIKERDESEEMYLSRIRKQWQPIFDNTFEKFIIENDHDDKWTFDFGIVKKEERQNKAYRHVRFLDYTVGVNYRCSMCPNKWSSYLPKVSFRILQNDRIDGKLGGGHVTIAVKSGQECKFCHLQQDKDLYEKGRLKKGEIERILNLVFIRIENFFYGKPIQNCIKKSLKPRKPRPHRSELCENCTKGDCEEVSL